MPSPETPDLAIWLTIGISALILIGIVASWVWFRGQQTEGTALWLHLLVLGIFPLFLLIIGNFAILEYSKERRFCGACHEVMKPYLDDLEKLEGESLAALHFQHGVTRGTECYACHATYGLHGAYQAKVAGLRHLYRYTSRTYHLPLTMRAAFDNGLCLKCHEGTKRFGAEAIHLDGGQVSAELRTGQTECIQCHGPAHALRKRRQANRPGGTG